MSNISDNFTLTLGRQFGSGGRKIARKVADMLGIEFYDKNLIAIAAKESGLSENLFDGIDEKPTNSLLYSLVMGLQSDRSSSFYSYGDILNSDTIFRIQSVSYTHLDVYKRQVLYRPFETLSNGEQTKVLLAALFLNERNFLLIDAVSYTHLDVYKRQVLI